MGQWQKAGAAGTPTSGYFFTKMTKPPDLSNATIGSDVIKARGGKAKAKTLSIKAKTNACCHKTKTEILMQNYNHIAYKIISVYIYAK